MSTLAVVDPKGVVRVTTDDRQVAMAKAARLAAPNISGGTPYWWEKGWRIQEREA